MTPAPRRLAAIAATAAALLAGFSTAQAAAEPPRTAPLFFDVPATGPGASPACEAVALLTEPPGWMFGDAAVVVVASHGGHDPARDRLKDAMLAEGAAVLELGPQGPCGGSAGPALFAALRALRQDAGAGLVVSVGHGAGGEAALAAVSETAAKAHLGPSPADRYAAAASFGAAGATFAPGPVPGAEQQWPMRAGLLCEVLARAATAESADGGAIPRRTVARDCLAALLPQGGDGRGSELAAVATPRR